MSCTSVHVRVRHRGAPGQDLRPDQRLDPRRACWPSDPQARVAVETLVTTGLVHVAGEVTTERLRRDPEARPRDDPRASATTAPPRASTAASCGVSRSRSAQQSPDIAQGVDTAYEQPHRRDVVDPLDKQGAGDQGLMFGYACQDTAELMPLPIYLAHRLAERLTAVRKSDDLAYLRPDGKTQVTIAYDGDKAVKLDTVVLSTQHARRRLARGAARARHPGARHRAGAGRAGARPGPTSTRPTTARSSTRPAGSRSVVRWATPASPDARSSSTPTAAWPVTAAARSPARTRRKVDRSARLRDALGGQERRGGGPGQAVRGAGRVCHRHGQAGGALRRDVRHRDRARRQDPGRDPHGVRPAPGGDRRRSSTCCARSTSRPPPTATSAAPRPTASRTPSRGSGPTGRGPRRRPSAADPRWAEGRRPRLLDLRA